MTGERGNKITHSEVARRRFTVPAGREAVSVARGEVRAFAEAAGTSPEVVGDATLAVSEAVTNALLHAFVGMELGTVTVICEVGRDRLRIRVIDDGRGMQPHPDSPGLGLGLSTIGRLAAGMDVRPGPGGVGTELAMTFEATGVVGPFAAPADPAHAALLAGAARLALTAAWPQEGIERLTGLVCGTLADAVCVDIVDGGTLRRVSALVDEDEELSQWLTNALPPMAPGTSTWRTLQSGEPALTVHDAGMPRTPAGAGERLGLEWWLSCPLPAPDGRILGILGLGGRGRTPVPDEVRIALASEIAERAAGGLAQARVIKGLQQTRARLEAVLGALGEAITVSGGDGQIIWANTAAARLLGFDSVEEFLAVPAENIVQRYHRTGEDGREITFAEMPSERLLAGDFNPPPMVARVVDLRTGRATWMRHSARPLDDGDGRTLVVNLIEDITDSRRAELRGEALATVGRILDTAQPASEQALQEICDVVAPRKADWCALDLNDGHGGLRRVAISHPDPELRALARRLGDSLSVDEGARRVLDGTPELIPRLPEDLPEVAGETPEQQAAFRRLALRSVVRVPLTGLGAVHGMLTLVHSESGRAFDENDLAFACDLGRRIGLAVAAQRLLSTSHG